MSRDTLLKAFTILVIGVGVQLLLILIGSEGPKDSPRHGTIEFARAYFLKDSHISDRICRSQMSEETQYIIKQHLQGAAENARSRGFAPGFAASMLYAVKTDIQMIDDTQANVRITAKRKTAINPVYFLVGLIFNLGETHVVDDTLRMVKENGQWKVCDPFSTVFQRV